MGGLVGLVILFGAGIFANFVAPYPVDQIDLTHVLAGADDCRRTTSSAPTRSAATS